MLEFLIRYEATGNVQWVDHQEMCLLLRWGLPVTVLSNSLQTRRSQLAA